MRQKRRSSFDAKKQNVTTTGAFSAFIAAALILFSQGASAAATWQQVSSVAQAGPFNTSSYDVADCRIYHPSSQQMDDSLLLHPVVVWAPGTGNTPEDRESFHTHLASHGFIVAVAKDHSNGSGQTPLACLDQVERAHDNPATRLFGHVDKSRVCAGGYSQGGAGALMVGHQRPDIDCTLLVSPYVRGFIPADENSSSSLVDCVTTAWEIVDIFGWISPQDYPCGVGHWEDYNANAHTSQPGPTMMFTQYWDRVTWNPFEENGQYIWDRLYGDFLWAEHDSNAIDVTGHSIQNGLGPYRAPATAFLREVLLGDYSHEHWYRGGGSILETSSDWDRDGGTYRWGLDYDKFFFDSYARPNIEPNPAAQPSVAADRLRVKGITAGTWHQVQFDAPFANKPIVAMGPVSFGGGDAVTVRVRNVTTQGFEFLVKEWDYLGDGSHVNETISYIAVEPGNYYWGDLEIDAGTVSGVDHDWKRVNYNEGFMSTPVVLTQQASNNGGQATAVRVRNSGKFGFDVRVQEEEANDGNHANEQIAYIAIKPGSSGFVPGSDIRLTAGLMNNVNDNWKNISFPIDFETDTPFIAHMQTFNGSDPATLRWQNQTDSGIQIHVQEEASLDTEIDHANENVGWVVVDDRPRANVAFGGSAYQSSISASGSPGRAIDGNTDGVYGNGSVTHTGLEVNARWKVLFGGGHDLFGVTIWNRTDCCADRLRNFRVEYLDANQNIIKSRDYSAVAPKRLDIGLSASNVHGVRIRLLGSTAGILSLAEVKAWSPVVITPL